MEPSAVALFAEELAAIEQVAAGEREVFGVSVSWQEEEFVAVEQRAAERGEAVLAHDGFGVARFRRRWDRG